MRNILTILTWITLATFSGSAHAQTRTWTGNGANWNTLANWTGGIPNSTSEAALFDSTGAAQSSPNVNASLTVGQIQFGATAPSYNITGSSTLTINPTSFAGVGILVTSGAADQTISANLALGSSQTWNIGGTTTVTANGGISGAFDLTKSGSGTLILGGNNGYSGVTAISAGVLRAAHNNALGSTTSGVTISSGAALELSGGISVPSGEAITTLSGTGIANGGALRSVSGNNTWGGNITLANVTGAHRINADADTLSIGGVVNETGNNNNKDLTFGGAGNIIVSGNITANGGDMRLFKDGTGTLTLNGSGSTFDGTTTVNAGTLVVGANAPSGANGALGNATSAVLLGNTSGSDNAALLTGGAVTVGRAVTVQSGSSGTATIGGNTANSSTFSGAISLNKNASISQVSGGTLNVTGGITSGNAGTKTLTVNNAGTVTVSGTAIANGSGSVALVKQGSGTLNLNVANTYSGGTTLNGGAITLGAANALGTTASGLNFAGGTLNANNRNTSLGALSLTANSTLNLVSGTATTLTFNGAASWTAGTLTINNWAGTQGPLGAGTDDRIFITGGASADFLSHTRFDISGTLYFATMNGTELLPGLTPVPEPTQWALIIFAVLGAFYKFVLPRLRRVLA